MKYYSNPATKIPLGKTAGYISKYKPGLIAFIASMLFSLFVSAQDNTPPVLIDPAIGCSSLTQNNVNECKSVATNFDGHTLESAVAALYQDPGGPVTATLISTVDSCACTCSWTFTYTYEIKDVYNNSVTCEVKRRGRDNTFPTFTAPAEITLYQNASCDLEFPLPSVSGDVTDAADNCGVISIIYEDGLIRRGAGITAGECEINIERIWHVSDNCGNQTDHTQLIHILDTIRPVFTIVPQNIISASCRNVTYTIEASDNCSGIAELNYTLSGATTESGYGSGDGVVFNEGVTNVTVTALDACGNFSEYSFTVTLTDNEPPVIIAPDISRAFADDNYGCSIDLGASATDNCEVVSFTSDAPTCFPPGTTIVTWTAIDQHGNQSIKTQTVTRIPPTINISICAGKTRTIYTGTTSGVGPLGPQSISLVSTATGGLPPYTYSWSPAAGLSNAGIANPVANPTATTTYTLTVTDALADTRTLSITIKVLPLSAAVFCGNGNNVKFIVCHVPPGNPSKPHNINISSNALNAHLTSGNNGHNNCYLGPCSYNCVSTNPGQGQYNGRGVNPNAGNGHAEFIVNVSPNPSNGEFLIQVFSKSNEPVTVRIFDNNGALRSVSSPASGTNYIIVGRNLIGGMYMAEVIQGNNRKVVKLMKLN